MSSRDALLLAIEIYLFLGLLRAIYGVWALTTKDPRFWEGVTPVARVLGFITITVTWLPLTLEELWHRYRQRRSSR